MPEQVSSYRLEGEIARGGMGIVYRGVHTVFEEVVAIKAIYPELTLNPELRQRFLNEAKIQRTLQHPNIVQIREFLIDQGKFYIVMEFIEGETLTQHLRQLGRPMLANEAIEVFRQALKGLGFAHQQGVIHRDIKPSNIMLTRQGVAKLTDFGIARALGSAKLTRTGTALGTPEYMSPEQIGGTELDHRTDIYSLGVTLYEMLTGRVPFERPKDSDSDYSVLEAHMHQAPMLPSQLVPEIPPFLEAAILKALEKRLENRFASCQEFQAAIAPSSLPATRKAVSQLAPVGPVKPAPQPSERKAEKERAEEARLAKEKAEQVRLAREKAERERARQERLARGKAEKDRKEKRPRVVVVSLLALVIAILAALAWLYRPNPPNPAKRQVPAPIVNNPQGNPNPPGAQAPEQHRESASPGKAKPAIGEKPQAGTERAEIGKKVNAAMAEGDQHYENGEYDRAISAYQTGLAVDPANTQLRQKIQRAKDAKAAEIGKKVNAAMAEGDQYYENGEYDHAISAYQTGLAVDPANTQLRQKIQRAKNAKAAESAVPQ